MREALTPTPQPLSDGYTAGWVWSYPLKAALEKAAANKDLTRAGLLAAAKSLTSVDYEGMLPAGSGNYAAAPNDDVVRTPVHKPDKSRADRRHRGRASSPARPPRASSSTSPATNRSLGPGLPA